MRIVIQRVKQAQLEIEQKRFSEIKAGLLVFVGIEPSDTQSDAEWLAGKILNLRIFDDSEGVMNLSVQDVHGEIMLVSQFTLHASTKKGNRPSYIKAARPEQAVPLYEFMIEELKKKSNLKIATGKFGADMQSQLTNSGPVTIFMDSKNKE